MSTRRVVHARGFTIIELLTVVSIIILIIGLIVPAIGYSRRIARELTVKTQIKTITEGLEGFYSDHQYYPPSNRVATTGNEFLNGAQSMTEALMGIDLHGFDPRSNFNPRPEENDRVYLSEGSTGASEQDIQASLNRRSTLYVTPNPRLVAVDPAYLFSPLGDGENLPASDLYMGGTDEREMAPVLCDAFGVRDVEVDGERLFAGTPFLYFLASHDSREYDMTRKSGNIYNWQDNEDLMKLPPLSGEQEYHEFWLNDEAEGLKNFYEAIRNPAITTSPRPHNMNTYIIISAGADGVYGTSDDITNFFGK